MTSIKLLHVSAGGAALNECSRTKGYNSCILNLGTDRANCNE